MSDPSYVTHEVMTQILKVMVVLIAIGAIALPIVGIDKIFELIDAVIGCLS